MDFSIDPAFQLKLDWMLDFVKNECEPLDILFPHHGDPYDMEHIGARAVVKPLQKQVKAQGLWACHLDPHLGGKGYGQMKLGLLISAES